MAIEEVHAPRSDLWLFRLTYMHRSLVSRSLTRRRMPSTVVGSPVRTPRVFFSDNFPVEKAVNYILSQPDGTSK